MLKTDKLLVVDLETTSTNPQRADILEVALALVDLKKGETSILLDTLIQPDSPQEEWADCWFMEHSALKPDLILQAPKFAGRIKDEIQAACYLGPLTAFNLNYDIQILYRHGIKVYNRAPCLMLTCKDILCLPGYYGDYRYPKFSDTWLYFFPNEPFEAKHRAGHDVLHEAKLAIELYKQGLL